MDFAFFVAWTLSACIGIIFARRILRSWINPVSVYWGTWTVSILVGRALFFSDSPLSSETWIAVVTAAIVFTTAGLLAPLLLYPRYVNVTFTKDLRATSRCQCVQAFAISRVKIVFLICLSLELIRLYNQVQWVVNIAGRIDLAMEYGSDVRTALILESVKTQPEVIGPLTAHLFSYFISLGGVSLFVGAYLFRMGQNIGLTPLVIEALISALGLQRYQFLLALLIFIWSYWYFRYIPHNSCFRKRTNNKKQLWLLIIIAIALMIAVWQVLVFRNPGIDTKRAIEHSLSYLGMPIWALDVRVRCGFPMYGMTYGASTFWGMAVWAKRLGFDVPLPPYHYDPVVLPGGKITNVFTYLINPLDDWGWAGLVFLPGVVAGVSSFLHLGIIRYGKVSWVPAQAVIMATIAMSFYTFVLKELYYILLIIGFLIFMPFLIYKTRPASRNNK